MKRKVDVDFGIGSTYTRRKLPKKGRRQEQDEACLGSCVLLLKQSCFFREEKKEKLTPHCKCIFFFSFNLYTVDLTLRPRRKIGRAENRRYFRLSKLQLEIFVGNKEPWYHSMSRDVDL